MITSFKDYRTLRENKEFEQKFHNLCETIVRSGVRFEDYWSKLAVPTINESYSYSNEEELLNVLEAWPTWPWLGGSGNKPAAGAAEPAPDFSGLDKPSAGQDMVNRMDQWQNDQRAAAAAAKEAARQKMLNNFQQGIDKQIETVKQRFATAMRDFLKNGTDDAKTQNDPHMYQIVNSFYKKIMSVAEPVANEFKIKAKFGKADYQDKFAREREAMMKNKTSIYKNQLAGKFGAVPGTADGAQPVSPPAPAAPAPAAPAAAPVPATTGGPQTASSPMAMRRGPGGRFLPRGS